MDALNSVENSLPNEREIARVVGQAADWTDRSLTAIYDEPRVPQARERLCGLSSEIDQRALARLGVKSGIYQLRDMHMKALGESDETIPTQHAVDITQEPGIPYLTDLTFCQFVTPEGQVLNNLKQLCGTLDEPLAQEIMSKGYFLLTDANLRALLRLTSPRKDADYLERINNITLADLIKIPPKVDARDPAILDSKFLDPYQ